MANEDVVDFGPGTAAESSSRRFPSPLRNPRLALPAAILGAAAAVVSLIGDWYTANVLDYDGPRERTLPISGKLVSLDMLGTSYLLLMMALIALMAIVLFGHGPARHNIRIAGLALSGAAAVIVLYLISDIKIVSTLDINFLRYGLPSELGKDLGIKIGQGLWAAAAAVVLLGLAFLMRAVPNPAELPEAVVAQPSVEEELDHPTDHPMELTVTNEIPQPQRLSEDDLEMYKRPR